MVGILFVVYTYFDMKGIVADTQNSKNNSYIAKILPPILISKINFKNKSNINFLIRKNSIFMEFFDFTYLKYLSLEYHSQMVLNP